MALKLKRRKKLFEFNKYQNILFRPVDSAALIFFRVAFGILALADVMNTWIYYHLEKNAFDLNYFQFKYYGFEWVRPCPEPWMSIFFLSLIIVATGMILGRWYRFCTLYFAFGFTYVFLLEKANYLNHAYLFCWLSFILIFLPADRNFSWSVWKDPARRLEQIPFWNLFLLRFMIGIVYFFGGLAKINSDWLSGIPLVDWMNYKSDLPFIGPVLAWTWTPYFMAYAGLLFDLTIVLFLLNRRTRPWAFVLAICFHLLNMAIFNIGIFPYLSVVLTMLYFPPDFPRKIGHWLADRIHFLKSLFQVWRRQMSRFPAGTSSVRYRQVTLWAIALLIAFHTLVPLRHYLFPGPVAWTEEGHRYSWRMMLRAKQGRGHFRIVDQGGVSVKIQPQNYLSSRQLRKMFTHPDMVLQFAHHLRNQYAREGKKVAIFAEIDVKLNGRPFQRFIDPAVNLATQEWHFFRHSDWILPLTD